LNIWHIEKEKLLFTCDLKYEIRKIIVPNPKKDFFSIMGPETFKLFVFLTEEAKLEERETNVDELITEGNFIDQC